MALAEGRLALDTGTAGLNLMTAVLTLMTTSKAQGRDDPSFAGITAQVPGQVFALSKELLKSCEELRQDFLNAGASLDLSIEQLQAD